MLKAFKTKLIMMLSLSITYMNCALDTARTKNTPWPSLIDKKLNNNTIAPSIGLFHNTPYGLIISTLDSSPVDEHTCRTYIKLVSLIMERGDIRQVRAIQAHVQKKMDAYASMHHEPWCSMPQKSTTWLPHHKLLELYTTLKTHMLDPLVIDAFTHTNIRRRLDAFEDLLLLKTQHTAEILHVMDAEIALIQNKEARIQAYIDQLEVLLKLQNFDETNQLNRLLAMLKTHFNPHTRQHAHQIVCASSSSLKDQDMALRSCQAALNPRRALQESKQLVVDAITMETKHGSLKRALDDVNRLSWRQERAHSKPEHVRDKLRTRIAHAALLRGDAQMATQAILDLSDPLEQRLTLLDFAARAWHTKHRMHTRALWQASLNPSPQAHVWDEGERVYLELYTHHVMSWIKAKAMHSTLSANQVRALHRKALHILEPSRRLTLMMRLSNVAFMRQNTRQGTTWIKDVFTSFESDKDVDPPSYSEMFQEWLRLGASIKLARALIAHMPTLRRATHPYRSLHVLFGKVPKDEHMHLTRFKNILVPNLLDTLPMDMYGASTLSEMIRTTRHPALLSAMAHKLDKLPPKVLAHFMSERTLEHLLIQGYGTRLFARSTQIAHEKTKTRWRQIMITHLHKLPHKEQNQLAAKLIEWVTQTSHNLSSYSRVLMARYLTQYRSCKDAKELLWSGVSVQRDLRIVQDSVAELVYTCTTKSADAAFAIASLERNHRRRAALYLHVLKHAHAPPKRWKEAARRVAW